MGQTRTPLCLKCGAPAGDAVPSAKPLVLGIGWSVAALAAASQLSSMRMPVWTERAAMAAVLGIVPIAWFLRGMSRRGTHWRCMRCRHEWLR